MNKIKELEKEIEKLNSIRILDSKRGLINFDIQKKLSYLKAELSGIKQGIEIAEEIVNDWMLLNSVYPHFEELKKKLGEAKK